MNMAAASLPPDDEILSEINNHFKNYLSNPENLESATTTLLDDIIEDAILGIVFEVHMEKNTRLQEIMQGEPDDDKYKIIDAPDLDIFGQAPGKKNYECICPSCNRSLAASRFAPHLEKCMGMGRNSSRLASKRIQTTANKETSGIISDDEDDADWTVSNEKKGKSKKKDKMGLKKLGKLVKINNKNGNSSNSENGQSNDSSVSNLSYDNMTEADKKALLSQICGVVSEHTKKICTRTSKCPQHTEEQKKAIREMCLSEPLEFSQSDNFQVDVDTYDEGDSLSMRESLGRSWEAENSNTSSPADSASTCSSSSKKRHK
ncbi:hypothetical protein RUM44_006517 [Polyplax serrata]|uniref:SAGA-associated factor 11 homolog n=1 Tax=Polyplax serrata TaxID=468196 RepID=A0ABR1AIA9_POLSC